MGTIYKSGIPYSGGGGGSSLPDGGTTGQALVKKSDTNQDVEWKNIGSGDGAEFSIDSASNSGVVGQGNDYFNVNLNEEDTVNLSFVQPNVYSKTKIVPTKEYVDSKAIVQVDTMPTARATEEGKIYQYIGATTVNYVNGYFYKCVEEETISPDPITYKWVAINVQSGGVGMSQEVLWESEADVGNVEQELSKSINDYDLLYVQCRYKWLDANDVRTTVVIDVKQIKYGQTQMYSTGATTGGFVYFRFKDDTHFQQVTQNEYYTEKVVGITFGSKLDGTIGRWEKIGEWIGNQTGLSIDLSPYNAISFSPIYSNESPRNSVIVETSDFNQGEALISENGDTWQGEFQNKGNNTYDIRLTGASKSVLYGYKETAISDADVQRIAQEVPSGSITYSTDERAIGTWIDGKTIYQKTMTCAMPTDIVDGTMKNTFVPHGVSNIAQIVSCESVGKATSGNVGGEDGNMSVGNIFTHISADSYQINLSANMSEFSGKEYFVTFRYTKTI